MSASASSTADHLTAEQGPRPVVALPRPGLPGAMIAMMALGAAIVLFLILNTQRSQHTARADAATASTIGSPPSLFVPPEVAPSPPPAVTVVTNPAPFPRVQPAPPAPTPIVQPYVQFPTVQPAQPVTVIERASPARNDPAIVYDAGAEQGRPEAGGATEQAGRSRPGGATAGGTGDDAPARATLIGNKTGVMPTGTIIPAVLETPIDTARPGLVRAVVSQDTRGFDGTRVLVSRGSRLIGEYQTDVRANQRRVLVNWTRLIRPDGVSIRLGSPAADPLGGAGVPGRLHSYFLERFAGALLQSALQVGVNLASRPGNNSVIVGLPNTTINNVAPQGLIQTSNLQPKITVKQGAAVNVFVARDLDFTGVPSQP